MSRKYFKWLGNLSLQDLERLAMHLLNQSREKRKFPYPKVTIKAISSMLESCYSTKEWVERRMRKQLVKRDVATLPAPLSLDPLIVTSKHYKHQPYTCHAHLGSTLNLLP